MEGRSREAGGQEEQGEEEVKESVWKQRRLSELAVPMICMISCVDIRDRNMFI